MYNIMLSYWLSVVWVIYFVLLKDFKVFNNNIYFNDIIYYFRYVLNIVRI